MEKIKINWLRHILFLMIFSNVMNANAQHVYQQGFDFLNSSEFIQAQSYFKSVIDSVPSDKTAQICYGRALGLGGQPEEGLAHFVNLKNQFPDDFELDLNLAEAKMWNCEYQDAGILYWNLLQREPGNYVANYGYANAQASIGNYVDALHYNQEAILIKPESYDALNARKYILLGQAYDYFVKRSFNASIDCLDTIQFYYPTDRDALSIRNQINEKRKSYVSINGSKSADDQNEAFSLVMNSKIYLSPKFDFKGFLILNKFEFLPEKLKTNQKVLNLGGEYHLNEKIDIEGYFGLNMVHETDKKFAINNTFSTQIKIRPNKIQDITLKYNNEVYSYSAQILRQNIKLNHFTFSHHINIGDRIGLYSNLIYTQFSDGNSRKFAFNSLYYKLLINKIKVGINYSKFIYDYDNSEFYFSPLDYQSFELFATLENNIHSAFWYVINLSLGQQSINKSPWRLSRRIDASLNYKFNQKMTISLQYLNSNVAQSLITGEYNFSRVGVSLTRNIQ